MLNFFIEIKKSKTVCQLYRFGLVGIASNLFGYILYLLLTYCGLAPKLTVSILYPIGAVIGFLGNREWVFSHQGMVKVALVRYSLVQLLGYLINLVILTVLVNKLGYPHQLIQLLAIFIVAVFLFVASKFFIYKKSILHGRNR